MLYRGTHTTFQAYFLEKWGYGRSHAYRLADAGEIYLREEASPQGDTIKLLDSEAHYRPLSQLDDEEQNAVIDLIGKWVKWSGQKKVTPGMVESAVAVLHPAAEATPPKATKNALVAKFEAAVDEIKQKLPADASKEVRQLIDQLKKKTAALDNPTRRTGIDWTDSTWNPLQGCSHASTGCDYCYAAKLVATRLADVYPGLASEVKIKGKKTYAFNNLIRLLPDQLGEPLQDRIPRRYFVNSMSDLFHDKVPDEFHRGGIRRDAEGALASVSSAYQAAQAHGGVYRAIFQGQDPTSPHLARYLDRKSGSPGRTSAGTA